MKRWFVYGSILSLAACGGRGPAFGAPDPVDERDITVQVDNHNFYDASIVLFFSGRARRRLGTVRSSTKGTFKIRWEASEMSVGADFFGGAAVRSNELTVSPGETLFLNLPPNAHRGNTPLLLARTGGS